MLLRETPSAFLETLREALTKYTSMTPESGGPIDLKRSLYNPVSFRHQKEIPESPLKT